MPTAPTPQATNRRCPFCDCRITENSLIVHSVRNRNDESQYFCPRCYREQTRECSLCHDRVLSGQILILQDGTIVCNTCRRYLMFQCNSCSTSHLSIGSRDDGFIYEQGILRVCPSCIGRYAICESCNEICTRSDMIEGNCRSCAADRGLVVSVRNHSYKPRAKFFYINVPDESEIPYFGLELEVLVPRNRLDMASALNKALPQQTIYFKEDGSLDNGGIEIVTHPMTLEYMESNNIFDRMGEVFEKHKVVSGDTDCCGFHVHVSKCIFPDSWYKNTMADYLYLHKAAIQTISRRTDAELDRWARIYSRSGMMYNPGTRYTAMNIEPEYTIEFRFFKGSVLPDTIHDMVKFIYNFVTICKSSFRKRDQFLAIPTMDLYENKIIPVYGDECKRYDRGPLFTSDRRIVTENPFADAPRPRTVRRSYTST